MASNKQGSSKRGFGAMDKQQQREIASQGGRSSSGSSQSSSQSVSQGNSQSGSGSNRGFASMDPQRQR